MSSESLCPLNSLVKIKGGKRLPAGKSLQTEPNSHPYIRVRDVGQRQLPRAGLEYVPDELFPPISRYIVEPNDIVLSIVGTIGALSIVDEHYHLASLTENCVKLHGLDREDALYLYYYLSSPIGQQEIYRGTVGAVQPKLPIYNIEKIPVYWPKKNARQSAALLLGALDDRISLLSETNTTLEAIAQAMFKSWFVDFDPVHAKQQGRAPDGMSETNAALFPDGFEESELGLVPRGWKASTMDEISVVGIGKTPPRKEPQWFSENTADVRWVSIRDMGVSGAFISQTSEYLTAESIARFNVRQVPNNTVLLSFKMTIGRVALTDGEMTTNEAIAHFKLEEQSPLTSEYIYLHLKQFDYSTLSSTSSIADAVNSKTVKAIPILVPDSAVLLDFQDAVHPVFERIKLIQQQAQTLATFRDTLLPRLISGQLRLPDLEGAVQ